MCDRKNRLTFSNVSQEEGNSNSTAALKKPKAISQFFTIWFLIKGHKPGESLVSKSRGKEAW